MEVKNLTNERVNRFGDFEPALNQVPNPASFRDPVLPQFIFLEALPWQFLFQSRRKRFVIPNVVRDLTAIGVLLSQQESFRSDPSLALLARDDKLG